MAVKCKYTLTIPKKLPQKNYRSEFIEGHQIVCQYFDKLNMTSKLTFETPSFIATKLISVKKRFQKNCRPEFIEGVQFDCQYFDKLNMTIKYINISKI